MKGASYNLGSFYCSIYRNTINYAMQAYVRGSGIITDFLTRSEESVEPVFFV
jgi:hypothetical protein